MTRVSAALVAVLAFGSTVAFNRIPGYAPTGQDRGDTYFDVTGDLVRTASQASARLEKLGGRVPALSVVWRNAETGQWSRVQLFFSEEFERKPGKYPVAYSYMNVPNTLGGSFIDREGRFSHDTRGTAEFLEFGEQVRVRFEFETFDGGAEREGRRKVTVKGEAACPWVDIF